MNATKKVRMAYLLDEMGSDYYEFYDKKLITMVIYQLIIRKLVLIGDTCKAKHRYGIDLIK